MKFTQTLYILSCILITIYTILIYTLVSQTYYKTKPHILSTTSIIHDAVKNIAQDTVNTTCLMGPSIDPHLYKPVESDIIKIASADIIFYNGLHLEAKMGELLALLSKSKITVAISKNIPIEQLIPVNKYENQYDPHIWFDIDLWINVVQIISQTLIDYLPEHRKLYELNTEQYIHQLYNLQKMTEDALKNVPEHHKVLITAHDAFSYFARYYHFQIVSLQGISTESSPGAYDMHHIIKIICSQKIPAIFLENCIPIKNIVAIQEGVMAYNHTVKLGGELYSDSLGPEDSDAHSYITMIQHNINTIAQALQ